MEYTKGNINSSWFNVVVKCMFETNVINPVRIILVYI